MKFLPNDAAIIRSKSAVKTPARLDQIYPVLVHIDFLGPNDDDVCVMVDGYTVFDPQLNLGAYAGNRSVTYSRERLRPGALVEMFTFDGWGSGYRTSAWSAYVDWSDGGRTTHTGGVAMATAGVSIQQPPYPVPNAKYWGSGRPWFKHYYPNGSFTLQR
jgi:hypothetical protein